MFGRKSAHETHRQGLMSELGESYGHLRRAAGHLTHGTAERLTPTYDRAKYAAKGGWDSTMAAVVPLYHQLREGANVRAHHMREGAMARAQHMREGASGRARAMMGNSQARALQKQQQHQFEKQFANKKFRKQYEQQFGKQPMVLEPPGTMGGRARGMAKLLVAGVAVGAATAAMRRRRARQAEWEEYDPMTGETRYYGAGASHYAEESAYGHRSAKDKVAAGVATAADSLSNRVGRLADSIQERAQGAHQGGQQPMTGPSGTGPAPGKTNVPGTMQTPPGTVLGPGGTPTRGGDPALGFPDET